MTDDVSKTDEEIAMLVQKGNSAVFGRLVIRYEDKLLRYGRKFLTGIHDVQDIVQEVFLKAYVNIKSFDSSRRFSPWIYRIAHNEFVNALKRRQRELFMTLELDVFLPGLLAKETADADLDKKEAMALMDQYLADIDPKYREILVLYYFEEKDYNEISEILHIPVSTVGVRLARGRAMLKKSFAHSI